jgi:N-acetylglucosaminyl-diphospho-decaprenol L-rhamnosyltransferase
MLLSIITLNYKKPELTAVCLESLYKQFGEEFKAEKIELIIVDNDSQDGSVEKLQDAIKKADYKNIQLIPNNENGGFAKGNNKGAKSAKGDFLLFLNNDTAVKDRGLLDMAEYFRQHEEVTILGGQLRNSDGSLQASTGKFYTLFNAFLLLLGMQKFGLLDKSPERISEVDWVKGGLLMIRKDIFESLQGFDEKIFMYTEDMELCYRARQMGKKIFFYPDVKVIHAEHGSANRSFAIVHIYKGLLYFYKKHRSSFEYQILKTLLLVKAAAAIMIGSITGNSYLVKTYKQAIES